MGKSGRKWARYKPKLKKNPPVQAGAKKFIPVKNYNVETSMGCDVAICIPSHNRYDMVVRLLDQLYNQKTKYSFQIILLNDGSTEGDYDGLPKKFNRLQYIKNHVSYSKAGHWVCYSEMWGLLRNIDYKFVLQMDDDFILCDNFLDIIVDTLIREREKNSKVVAVAPHTWSFTKNDPNPSWVHDKVIDGIGLFDISVIRDMGYTVKPVTNVTHNGASVKVWVQFTDYCKQFNKIFYRTDVSLVYHDGNDNPQLHPGFRNIKRIYTQKLHSTLKIL